MNRFKLRFRRRKLAVAIGFAIALAVVPMLRVATAAGVPLDVTAAAKLVDGPGSPTDYRTSLAVQQGNVAQFSIIAHNPEDAKTGQTAKNFRIKVTIPKTPATHTTATVQVLADNGVQQSPYHTTDTVNFNSANGAVFNMTNFRSVAVQHNNVPKTNTPTFNWTDPQILPDAQVESSQTADAFVMVIHPNANGDLGPCFQNAVRVLFLADVQQAPNLTINKQIREAGQTGWKEGPIQSERGKELEYQVAVKNTGFAQANNVVIRDALPPKMTLVSGSCQVLYGLQPVQACSDNFVLGGLQFANLKPGSAIYVKIRVKTNQLAANIAKATNAASVKSNETPEVNDTASVTYVVAQASPSPSPSPTPTPTPSPTPTATPTPSVSPTPTPTPTATPTPVIPQTPPGPPAQELPKTGGAEAAMTSAIALIVSAYLYLRERRSLKRALKRSKVN